MHGDTPTKPIAIRCFACSFFKNSYSCHGSALNIDGLASLQSVYVNHEQSPKKTTSRLSQRGIDLASKTNRAGLLMSSRL
jgi:hypothetical protein